MSVFTVPVPLSLYIHLPWCVRKCPYCDFNSHAVRGDIPEDLYVTALMRELDERLPEVWGRGVVSLFFGGGTPSLFSPQAIEKILLGVRSRLRFGPDTEVTLEANPGTIDEARFKGFREAGVNRLSIGLQSLQNDKLKSLGRIHDRDVAIRAIEAAQQAGFDNFNVDLMHGLPGQSVNDALSDLQAALEFNPQHLSWYQLTIEPNTLFHHQPPVLPVDETVWEIQEAGKIVLAAAGLQQYEVSAYAKPDSECMHNKNYWEFGDYLGIGAGAHSKITDMDQQVVRRYMQVKHPQNYLQKMTEHAPSSRGHEVLGRGDPISTTDLIFEFMLNALRLTRGVPARLFTERTGLTLDVLEPMLTQAKEKKLLVTNADLICATELGQRFLNDLVAMFLQQ